MLNSSLPESGFSGLNLLPELLQALEAAEYTTPTPIQTGAIPVAISGSDVIGIAQTGTGKTLAFTLPMVQYLLQHPGTRGLVVAPTRELAIQIDETMQKIGRRLGISSTVIIGGAAMSTQVKALKTNPRIIVATPGRLNDHIQQGTVHLNNATVVVLDEADRMLDMGFLPQIEKIMATVPKERQTMLFSATMPVEIVGISARYLKTPLRVEIERPGTANTQVSHELIILPKDRKRDILQQLLVEYFGTVLVFSRTKHGAKKLAEQIREMGHSAAELHANRSLAQRRAALDGFKAGQYRVLVATDIAARGIDVSGIVLVLNFDLPDSAEDYVHRIGRTGRAGLTGHAISFATPDQFHDVKGIEKLLGAELPRSQRSETNLDPGQRNMDKLEQGRRGMQRGGGGGRQQGGQQPHARGDRERAPRQEGPREDRPQHSQPSHGDSNARPARHNGSSAAPAPRPMGGGTGNPAPRTGNGYAPRPGGGGQGGSGAQAAGQRKKRRPMPPPRSPFGDVSESGGGFFMSRPRE